MILIGCEGFHMGGTCIDIPIAMKVFVPNFFVIAILCLSLPGYTYGAILAML